MGNEQTNYNLSEQEVLRHQDLVRIRKLGVDCSVQTRWEEEEERPKLRWMMMEMDSTSMRSTELLRRRVSTSLLRRKVKENLKIRRGPSPNA